MFIIPSRYVYFIVAFISLLMSACASAPDNVSKDLNSSIINEVKALMGEKVGRGECWDLPQYILDKLGASWNRPFTFGRKLKKSEPYKSGDIIQFNNVIIKWTSGNRSGTSYIGMPDHTAVIWEVENNFKFKVAQQNFNNIRKVGIGDVDLTYRVSGSYQVYRPYINSGARIKGGEYQKRDGGI